MSLLGLSAGLLFAGMAVVSLVSIMPAAFVADHLGRKWTIVPSAICLASAILLMAHTGSVLCVHCLQPAETQGSDAHLNASAYAELHALCINPRCCTPLLC